MKYIISVFILLIAFNAMAQKEHFQIVDASTNKPIYGVKIKSFLTRDLVTFSNDSGYFNITIKANDTLSISKDYYHTMYVTVNMKNFDSLHTLILILAPSKQKSNQVLTSNLGGLQYFEYQFSHTDPKQDSNIGLRVYEPKEAVDVRMDLATGHNDFRFGNINVDHINLIPHHNQENQYVEQEHSAPRK
jgi:hypothetical protein